MVISFSVKADKAQAALDGLAKGVQTVQAPAPVVGQDQDNMDLAAIADSLVKAGNALSGFAAKVQQQGNYTGKTDIVRTTENGHTTTVINSVGSGSLVRGS